MFLKLRGILRAVVRLVVIATVTYLGGCALVAWKKEGIIFPLHGKERAAKQGALPGFETWWMKTPEGEVEAWWRPAEGASAERPAPAVMVFHGNGELIDDSRDFAQRWRALGAHVLLVEYRGYGRSAGEPTIAACKADAAAWFDKLAERAEVRRELIVAHGFSLGGVFAAELAGQRAVGGLVLECAPAGLVESARDRGIWLVLTREGFDAVKVLRALPTGVPVLITHGQNDYVVSQRHGQLLAAARPDARVVWGKGSHYPLAVTERPELLAELLAAAKVRAGLPAADKGLAQVAVNSAL